MKKSIIKVFTLTVLTVSVSLIGCKSDEITNDDDKGGKNELKGQVMGTVTLDASKEYNLTGSYIVQSGGKLVIPAGTKIIAAKMGTSAYIAVLKGGEIDIKGTEISPVIMTSKEGKSGDWGGLTICGKATTSAGVDAKAEVGDFKYGGTDDSDNSGSIKYLTIKGTGAAINANSEYNGISFYAVGSGTTLDHIAVINGNDDGVEFFGGSAKITNLYLENNADDSIDWTEGWKGSVEKAYISHTKSGFSTAFEGDKANGNPTFKDITAISTVGGTALQFKATSGATITNLYLEGYDKNIDMKEDGPLSNVNIERNAAVEGEKAADGTVVTAEVIYQTGKLDISTWAWFNK